MSETLLAPAEILPAPPAYPTITESWGAVGWYLLATLLLGIPAMLVAGRTAGLARLVAVASAASLGLTIWWLRRRAGPARWHMSALRGPGEKWGWYALLPLLVLLQGILLSPLHLLHLPNWTSGTFKEIAHYPVFAFLFGCVAAPVFEELLFRGILLNGLLRNYSPAVAIGQSALLFGVFHFNPAQSLNAALMGLLLGWLYYQTRALGMCIGLHALNNLLAFSAMNSPRLENTPELSQSMGGVWYLVVLVVAALALAGCLWWLRRLAAGMGLSR
ncbi:type II CAAX endopeptidase family protein [Hymenobacter sp. H14-R3]|uniref:CPBP family intramembrane glutamic endopeptidase n=1 Tax=Hymenobacter sp. H14-R3 TaxID=3046308 RepID=UPI0024B977F3|nr:type II CAAX endopeptidase family protein [Hymenobacter sp. H14-R3]MDJ0363641.1 type II CAAX endopeptidase family protein [Hymenobacter sp. H14-R3]